MLVTYAKYLLIYEYIFLLPWVIHGHIDGHNTLFECMQNIGTTTQAGQTSINITNEQRRAQKNENNKRDLTRHSKCFAISTLTQIKQVSVFDMLTDLTNLGQSDVPPYVASVKCFFTSYVRKECMVHKRTYMRCFQRV